MKNYCLLGVILVLVYSSSVFALDCMICANTTGVTDKKAWVAMFNANMKKVITGNAAELAVVVLKLSGEKRIFDLDIGDKIDLLTIEQHNGVPMIQIEAEGKPKLWISGGDLVCK